MTHDALDTKEGNLFHPAVSRHSSAEGDQLGQITLFHLIRLRQFHNLLNDAPSRLFRSVMVHGSFHPGGTVNPVKPCQLHFNATKQLSSMRNHLPLPHPTNYLNHHNFYLGCCHRTESDFRIIGLSSIPSNRHEPWERCEKTTVF